MDGATVAPASGSIHKVNQFVQTRFKLLMHFRDNLVQGWVRVDDVTMKLVKQLSVCSLM
jgi:hypothetical protein